MKPIRLKIDRGTSRARCVVEVVITDGGRAAAGFKGKAGDCAIRAIAVATGRGYAEVHAELSGFAFDTERPRRGRSHSNQKVGFSGSTIRRYMAKIGWKWTPTMFIGSGCNVHLRPDQLPAGRLVVNLSRHVCAVVDGVVHDAYDPSRSGTRCVYGYWSAP